MLGTQPGYKNNGPTLQMMLSFELHKKRGPVRNSNGEIYETSRIMSCVFSAGGPGYNKSTLTQYAGALRGKDYSDEEIEQIKDQGGFDPETLLEKSCRISITHEKSQQTGKLKDKIASVAFLDPDDDVAPEGMTDSIYWDWTLGEDCPKRIQWFWARAKENPDREDVPRQSKPNPSAVAAVSTDPDDTPF